MAPIKPHNLQSTNNHVFQIKQTQQLQSLLDGFDRLKTIMLLTTMVMRRTMTTMVRQVWFVGKDDVSDGGDDDVSGGGDDDVSDSDDNGNGDEEDDDDG